MRNFLEFKCIARAILLFFGCYFISGFDSKRPPPYLVSIKSGNSHGSGTIVGKPAANTYLIITSSHVIDNNLKTTCLGFFDGTHYTARVIKNGFNVVDLALLLAKKNGSSNIMPVRLPGNVRNLRMPVISYGYSASGIYTKSDGTIQMVLEKPLQGGYDIGFSSVLVKGMSGGPTIENNEMLIAINSLHPDPLWDANIYYQDGRLVGKEYQTKIEKLSMGISAERIKHFVNSFLIKKSMIDKTNSTKC